MNRNSFKLHFFVYLMFLVILTCSPKSFAQDDSSSNEQASEVQAQQTLNQIHYLEEKMKDNAKQLDALEKAVNQSDTQTDVTETTQENSTAQEVPVQTVPEQAVSTQVVPVEQAPPVQAAAPVQLAYANTSPEDQSINAIKAEPVDVLPQSSIYYAPVTFFPKEHTFEISPETFYSSFKETGSYEVYKKAGEFYGLNMAYSYRPLDAATWPINVYHIDFHGDYGMTEYSYEEDKIKNVNDYIVEPRVWFGKDFNFGTYTTLTPYLGAGYRWYYDQLKKNNDNDGDGGFNIQTQYVYIPVGAQLSVRPIEGWRIDLNSEYDRLVWGNVTNYISEQNVGLPGFANITNTLTKGYGIRGSIKIVKEEQAVNYFVEPYIRYWSISDSDTKEITFRGIAISPYHEDKNQTFEAGARAGIEF